MIVKHQFKPRAPLEQLIRSPALSGTPPQQKTNFSAQNMKLDKRTKRTREWLLETLLELLKTKEYAEISITELTEQSGIARQTFYRNYDSMDDILVSKMDKILDEYLDTVQQNLARKEDPDWHFEVQQLIFIWQENEAIFKALQKAGLSLHALDKLTEIFNLFHMKIQNLQQLDEYHQYLVYNLTGGIYNVLNKWFENEMNTPTEIIAELFIKAARNIDQLAKEYEAGR